MTERTSEEVMRDEFEKCHRSQGYDADFFYERMGKDGCLYSHDITQYRWEGFQLGQKSLAAKVPVEAIEEVERLQSRIAELVTCKSVDEEIIKMQRERLLKHLKGECTCPNPAATQHFPGCPKAEKINARLHCQHGHVVSCKICEALAVPQGEPISSPSQHPTPERAASGVQLKFHAIGDRPLVEVVSRGEQAAPERAKGKCLCSKATSTPCLIFQCTLETTDASRCLVCGHSRACHEDQSIAAAKQQEQTK